MQVAEHLARRIAAGELALNTPLPAEVRLAQQYGVSLGTARRATELLRERGLVVTLPCKGTFVAARPDIEATGDAAMEEPQVDKRVSTQKFDR
ncbi:winged helix-turn-helix domain-containing protein [Amycolatopsis taiwanensis]|uniref:GntR family transcriptional regulator n=1 Tax=Amycolatopsis taiwanensis TaxID=342230 RepID=UPI002557BA04|nr:winged helix-turn-helix domain-containing protein [Amycolatopsis taiwanensis]